MWTYVFLGLRLLLGLAFLAAGGAKLAGVKPMVETFDKIGYGQWFRYVTAAVELAAAVMVVVPQTVPYGAGLLVATMAGATIAHLTVLGDPPVAPVVLGSLAGLTLWLSLA